MARLSSISLPSLKPSISALILVLVFGIASIQAAPPLVDVQIVTELEPDMFPESWRTPRINAQATALAENQKERSKRIILKALAKYPHSLLVQNLRKVYIVESLGYFGVWAGGTNSRDCIYIANNGNERTYTDKYLEELLQLRLSLS